MSSDIIPEALRSLRMTVLYGLRPATCEVEGEVAEVYESDNEIKTDAQYNTDTQESITLCEKLVDGPNSKEISSSSGTN